jgi:4-diphosphocytidyl-2-C-methyl-D-erythritol kinase
MLTLEAPAKINLSLRVLHRRADGYHEIATRMAPLTLADRLTMELLPTEPPGTVQFTCSDPTVPGDESNLAVKVLRALEPHSGPLPALRIHLEKHIPHGAGLGGGSSDAAAVLRGLTQLLSPAPSRETLLAAAAATGSDVPFFLHRCVCDCTGRGEIVTPVPDFSWSPRILLLKPPFPVPTPDAYRGWQTARDLPGQTTAPQFSPAGPLVNDLERPVFEKYPVLALLKSRLQQSPGVTAALMSGSGSTVFAVLEPAADAAALVRAAEELIGADLWSCDTAILTH